MAFFKGYMRMYAKSYATSIANTQYTEDWADSRKRSKILGKPRRYILTIYLFNTSGEHMVETVEPPKGKTQKLNQEGLSDMVYKQINRMMDENPYQEFDLINSYINIRA